MLNSSRLTLVANVAVGKMPVAIGEEAETAGRVRSELQRILSSDQFDASERNRRFLEYAVEETLAGRGDRIKAYTIATIVFGRDDSFDPTLDPVVRMEARRLRRSLERFYLVEGARGPVSIALPKGGYVPKFQNPSAIRNVPDRPVRSGAVSCAHRRPSVLIAAFDSEPKSLVHLSDGLVRRIAVSLSCFSEFTLFMQPSVRSANPDGRSTDGISSVDYVLSGDIAASHDMFKVTATLQHASSGKVVWAQMLVAETASEGLPDPRDRIAALIAQAVSEGTTVLDDVDHSLNQWRTAYQLRQADECNRSSATA